MTVVILSDCSPSWCHSLSQVSWTGDKESMGACHQGGPRSQVVTGSLCVPLLEQGEGRVVYVRNLSSDMNSLELKRRFEVFGEVVECQVLTRSKR